MLAAEASGVDSDYQTVLLQEWKGSGGRCPSAQTMKYGPARQLESSSRCHGISTRCTGAPQSWQGGAARATRSALFMGISTSHIALSQKARWSLGAI
jgi:hypothetical protein